MDKIEDFTNDYSDILEPEETNTSRISNTLQAIFTSYQRFIKVRKLQDS